MKPGDTLGSYRVLEKLGEGGMGEVYRARDTKLEREVAIKILSAQLARDPEALARFEREALSVARLSHPNILAIHEFGRAQDMTFVVTELVDGETLRQRLANGPLPVRRAVAYAQQIARGIAAAHARAIVHRDLKPENVMIGRDDQVKILDFGLAKPVEAGPIDETRAAGIKTGAGVVLGTFAYMAPEQVRGLTVDHRADIFAFGAVLFEMLSGERPFKGETAADTMTAILTREPPDLDVVKLAIAPNLDRIVRRCLEKTPELRFQSANDLAFALETLSTTSAATSTSAAAVASGTSSTPVVSAFRRNLPWAIAALAVIAAAGAGFASGKMRTTSGPAASSPRYTRMTFRRGFVNEARFAADGQSLIYSAVWDSEPQRMFALRVDRPRAESPSIVDGGLMAVSAGGDVAVKINPDRRGSFIEYGTLAQMPLAGGQPRPLLENVLEAAYAPDGRIAVVRTAQRRSRLEFPAGTTLYETPGWISAPRFSADGARIAFIEHPLHDDDRGWPAIVEVATRAKRNVTAEFATISGLAWAPDEKEICFATGVMVRCAAAAGGAVRVALHSPMRLRLNDIGKDGRILATGYVFHMKLAIGDLQGREVDLSWQDAPIAVGFNRDGSRLLFGTGNYDTFLRDVTGAPPVRLGGGTPFGLSPDDRFVAAIAPEVPTKIAIIPTGAGETRLLPRGPIDSHDGAVWMPDGRRLVISANEPGKGVRLFVQSIDGGDPSPISAEGVHLLRLGARAISADGQTVIAVGPDGVAALYPIAGGAPQAIGGLGSDLAPIGWSETPNVMYARPIRAGRLVDIYRVDVVTGKRQLWRTIGPADPTGAPLVATVLISPDGRRYGYSSSQMLFELFLIQGVFPTDQSR